MKKIVLKRIKPRQWD